MPFFIHLFCPERPALEHELGIQRLRPEGKAEKRTEGSVRSAHSDWAL